jgi:TPR repeat protein
MEIKKIDLFTVDVVIEKLRQFMKEDIPQEYKNWARDGIIFVERNPEANILDFPNNIFGYIKKEPMPQMVRELVEGIYLQEINKRNGMAACSLGALYYTGKIGEQSFQKAMDLYEIAADTGDIQALENLGYCYYYGRDCEVNYEKAYRYFSKCAFLGKVTSLYKVGDIYKNGYYVEQDPTEAFRIYSHCIEIINHDREAAKDYDADVYVRYADCFLNAIGCDQDVLKALYWAQRAEYEFRLRESRNVLYTRHGIDWSVELITRCRYVLEGNNNIHQPS